LNCFERQDLKQELFFARKILDTGLEFNAFVAQLQQKLQEMKIGVMRIEELDLERGRIILTVSEDAELLRAFRCWARLCVITMKGLFRGY